MDKVACSCRRLGLAAVVVLWAVSALLAEVPFQASFEDGNVAGWRAWDEKAGKVAVVPRGKEEGGPGQCLSVTGNTIWISAAVDLPAAVPLDGPVYVTADVRSLGKSGGVVGLLVANRGNYTYYKTGPAGFQAKDGWVRGIWKLDGFFPDEKDVRVTGLRFVQRVAGEHEHGPDGPGHHEMRMDNVAVHTGEDARRIAEECETRGGQRCYDGPAAFVLWRDKGLTAWHVPSAAKVFRWQPPPSRKGEVIHLSTARHEAESFQIALRAKTPLAGISVRLSELKADEGGVIPAAAWYWHPVRYVSVTSRYFGIPIEQWWPEPLSWDREVSLAPDSTQAIWVTLDTPAETRPGTYRGSVDVLKASDVLVSIPVAVKVWNFRLPARPTFRTNQQLWVSAPSPLDPRPKAVVEREMFELLARCRQFDGSGFHRLPKALQMELMARGQNTIKLPFVGGHHGGASRQVTKLGGADIFTPEYERAFFEHLSSRTEFIRQQGWMEHAHLYLWDEPFGDPEVYRMIVWLAGLAKRFDPKLKTRVAAPCGPELLGKVDIFSSGYSTPEAHAQARQRGAEIWMTGVSAFMVDLPGIDQRMCYGFESIQRGFTGACCWGLAVWGTMNREKKQWESADPWNRPQRANRNCFVLYPGNTEHSRSEKVVPSLSLELTRDGIEDYEYVTMLEAKANRFHEQGHAADAQKARSLLERCRAFYVAPKGLRTDFRAVDALSALRAEVAAVLED